MCMLKIDINRWVHSHESLLVLLVLLASVLMVGLGVRQTWLQNYYIYDKQLALSGRGQPTYLRIDPPFVIKYHDRNQEHMLHIEVELKARSEDAKVAIQQTMPVIKNDLLALFLQQPVERFDDFTGKEQLRKDALAIAQAVVSNELGYQGVDDLLFTKFVMQ